MEVQQACARILLGTSTLLKFNKLDAGVTHNPVPQ